MPNIDFNGDGRGDVLWLLDGDVAVSNWLGTAMDGFIINDGNAYNQLNAMHQFVFEATATSMVTGEPMLSGRSILRPEAIVRSGLVMQTADFRSTDRRVFSRSTIPTGESPVLVTSTVTASTTSCGVTSTER